MIRKIVDAPLFIWIILALPGFRMTNTLLSGATGPVGQPTEEYLLHPSGESAAQIMILAMMITPFRMMFPKNKFWAWMLKRRRYFGVAAFVYAVFHTVLYIVDMGTVRAMLDEFTALGIWTGWLAFFIFIPLALTSNDYSVRALGSSWKTVHRFVYVAAIATLVHWIFVHNNIGPALARFVPLALLEGYRIWRMMNPKSMAGA
ncbi:MAG: ferric reductase-like transmembrane domain-containing protein [Rhodospirillaceae bacterium]|nr:ferric reductase-like transmembrane domain-containing protein [Rhodospirillaceae bacterium]